MCDGCSRTDGQTERMEVGGNGELMRSSSKGLALRTSERPNHTVLFLPFRKNILLSAAAIKKPFKLHNVRFSSVSMCGTSRAPVAQHTRGSAGSTEPPPCSLTHWWDLPSQPSQPSQPPHPSCAVWLELQQPLGWSASWPINGSL